MLLSILAVCAIAHEAEVTVTYDDGSVVRRRETLVGKGGNVFEWRADRKAFGRPVKSVAVLPDFATATEGEDGWFINATGVRGDFRHRWETSTNRFCEASYQFIPLYGMKTPRTAFVAFATGMKWHAGIDYSYNVTNHRFAVTMAFHEDMHDIYEDPSIEYHLFDDPKAGYNEMAHAYRDHQIAHNAFRPLAERMKERPELAYAVKYPEIRIRQAWKPVPSTVNRQVPENEPPVTPHVSFARVAELAKACRDAGVKGAEFCLVGWNRGGHDGAYPQLFPVEASLGGEQALRKCVADVQALGYQIVAHGNHNDAYMLADCWDAEYVLNRTPGGELIRPEKTWGGGGMFSICPRRAYERFAIRDAARVAALGFRGLYYLDVLTCHVTGTCYDPRHPLTRRDSVKWGNRILDVQTDTFGGVASEGACDAYIGHCDSVLTVCWAKPFQVRGNGMFNCTPVPFWELVYHGAVVYTPFRCLMNATANPDPRCRLKLAEFGGRPTFYIHSRFHTKANANMGDRDLRAETDEELADSVDCIRRGYDEYEGRAHLQCFAMERHEEIAANVFSTTYANGESLIANYNDSPFETKGVTVPAMSWKIVRR